ncbi:hypothetical protein [Methylobacterium sp. PvR107]|uniref:hypothetical protein n=1 Tax=Methylobacterium sp. PvR107 TaxID=2806597 RepID=UPI001AE7B010|nr:hypothetical protein [Methylobacterium sp. PvR107]MBP1183158.1 hypothetical protein [Methylobacterium sp. PvR107]
MTRPITILALMLMSASVAAESQTGMGDDPASTATALNTSWVGRAMPLRHGAGTATPNDRRNRTNRAVQNDRLMRGICIGCSAR